MSETVYWVLLSSIPKVGPKTFARLVEHFGSAEAAACAPPEEHDATGILKGSQMDHLAKAVRHLEQLEQFVDELSYEGIRVLTLASDDYPETLRRISSAPPVLYVRGALGREEEPAVAVVGTRSPTEEGVRAGHDIAAALAERGLTIVSGLAAGCDTAGHEGALDVGGRTIAVVGSGLMAVHPQENQPLADRIARDGALVSECFPTSRTSVAVLMARNRLQSALSRAVIVIETGATGGSLGTVKDAQKQGRLLFAWHTDRDCPQAEGTRALVTSHMARPLRGPEDIDQVIEAVCTWSPPEPEDETEAGEPQLSLF